MCTPAPARFLISERLFTFTTISEPGTGKVDVKNEKNNGFLAGVSLPPSSRAPRVSLAPKTPFPKAPFPFPFKRLPRRLFRLLFPYIQVSDPSPLNTAFLHHGMPLYWQVNVFLFDGAVYKQHISIVRKDLSHARKRIATG